MVDLQDISDFGGIDADADRLLDECFEDHEAYARAKDGDKYLIVGRKGSGKTAIYRKIGRLRQPDVFSFGHTFRDYPWHHHDKQKSIGVPEQECYSHSWKYLILITLSKILLNQDQSQPWDEFSSTSLSAIETFIFDTYGSRDPDVTQVFQPNTRLKLNASFGVKGFGLEAKVSPQQVAMEHLPTVIHEVNSNLMDKVIRSLNPANRYYVLFDELDLGFSKTEENYRLRLIGLIHAARDINNFARETGRRLNVVVFLRDDIYQFLQFEDKNKITESGVARIEWDTPRTIHTLQEVMSKRLSNVRDVPEKTAWPTSFNEEQKMRGHQTKYQHILDRTMLRPRDIIKFCNEILNSYKRNSQKTKLFENVDVAAARKEYSQYLYSELEDEIFKHIPDNAKYFELLRDLEAVQFDKDEFESICEARKDDIIAQGTTARAILGQLFEFSIIGYYQPGGSGYGGAEYVFRYKSPRAEFNSSAAGYQVHLGLQDALGLKRYRRGAGTSDDEGSESD